MSDDNFEDEASIGEEDLDEEDLGEEDLDEEDLDDDDSDLDDLALDGDLEEDAGDGAETVARVVEAPARAKGDEDDDEDVLDLDEELHPDDVEAPLDALLQEKTAAAKMEDEEEELEDEEPESDERGDVPARIVPRRAGEFLCSSCFLVLPRNQLQDEERMLCRDCA